MNIDFTGGVGTHVWHNCPPLHVAATCTQSAFGIWLGVCVHVTCCVRVLGTDASAAATAIRTIIFDEFMLRLPVCDNDLENGFSK